MPESVQPPTPRMTELVLGAAMAPGDIPVLCEQARERLEADGADMVVCDVGALAVPDMTAVDAVARLHLTATRLGCQIRLRHASCALRDLLCLSGLGDVVGLVTESGVEPRRQLEQREQPVGIEERVDPDHSAGGDLDHLE